MKNQKIDQAADQAKETMEFFGEKLDDATQCAAEAEDKLKEGVLRAADKAEEPVTAAADRVREKVRN